MQRVLDPFERDEKKIQKVNKIRWRLARDSAIICSAVRSKKLLFSCLTSRATFDHESKRNEKREVE